MQDLMHSCFRSCKTASESLTVFLFGKVSENTQTISCSLSGITGVHLIDDDPRPKEQTHRNISARHSRFVINVPKNAFYFCSLSGNGCACKRLV